MKIDLHNFFKYYDPNLERHVKSVQWLEDNLPPEFLDSDSEWVRTYRNEVPGKFPNPLKVPFYPQTDNYTQPDRTCNSSSCAMCLEYFKPGTLTGAKGDDEYIKSVFSIGDTTDHGVQTKALQKYGVNSLFSYNLTFADLDKQLSEGKPVVIGILHRGPLSAPKGGHMCVVIGKKGQDYIVNDPYGNLKDGYTSSVYNGKGAIYSRHELSKRWCPKGTDGWGRIFYSEPPKVTSGRGTAASTTSQKIPEQGIKLIKEFEGCHLKAYPDPLTGDLPITIGWGSTRDFDGKPFKLGREITQGYADKLLIFDIEKRFLSSLEKIPYWGEMGDGQKGALLSFAYNLGANFYGSARFSTISKNLRLKDWNSIPETLKLYRNPGTNVEAGLLRRRIAEGNIWKNG